MQILKHEQVMIIPNNPERDSAVRARHHVPLRRHAARRGRRCPPRPPPRALLPAASHRVPRCS